MWTHLQQLRGMSDPICPSILPIQLGASFSHLQVDYFTLYAYFWTEFFTLTAHFEAEFSTPHASF